MIGGTSYTIPFAPDPLVIINGTTAYYTFSGQGTYGSFSVTVDSSDGCHVVTSGSGKSSSTTLCWTSVLIDITEYSKIHVIAKRRGNYSRSFRLGIMDSVTYNVNTNTIIYSDTSTLTAEQQDYYFDISEYSGNWVPLLRIDKAKTDSSAPCPGEIYFWALE